VPGKNPHEAAAKFAFHFRESLSVVTNAYLKANNEGDRTVLLYEPPVRLQRRSGDPLYLSVTQTYQTIPALGGGFKAKTTGYMYELLVKKDGSFATIVEFHWHPLTTKKLKWPHLHIKGNTAEGELDRKHFPTARLCIEDFLRFLIRDFNVTARLPYADWKEILTRNKREFVANASWLHYGPLIA
jgi:hypothetical protein